MEFIHEPNRIYVKDEHGGTIVEATFPDLPDGTVVIDHTYVDPILRGKGVASELMEHVCDEIGRQGKKTYASCPYAVAWFRKHPDRADILLK